MSRPDAQAESLAIPDRVRQAVDERDQLKCRVCGKYLGDRRALHHIRFGGDHQGMGGRRRHDPNNILTVCWLPGDGDCHQLLHSRKHYWMPLALYAAGRTGITVLALDRLRQRPRTPDRYHPWSLDEFVASFWARVQVTENCWLWTGPPNEHGYGQVNARVLGFPRPLGAHRVAFYLEHGRWPTPSCLHSCDTPACVRSDHLREGDQVQNMADRRERRPRHGATNPAARLTEVQALEIRAAMRAGARTAEVSASYGVSTATVLRIAAGRTYRTRSASPTDTAMHTPHHNLGETT